jgi:uncharacterized membrane protein
MKKDKEKTAEVEKEEFELELNEENLGRISRIVSDYNRTIMTSLDKRYFHNTKKSDRLADSIASFGGSWRFIIIFASFLLLWILLNTLPFFPLHFDPQPFILLNLCLSFIAAFQAPIIMMSQNRQAARDKHESVIDFAINFKAEQEVDDMQVHLHKIEQEVADIKKLLLELKETVNK